VRNPDPKSPWRWPANITVSKHRRETPSSQGFAAAYFVLHQVPVL
jgi:hypothetical protein